MRKFLPMTAPLMTAPLVTALFLLALLLALPVDAPARQRGEIANATASAAGTAASDAHGGAAAAGTGIADDAGADAAPRSGFGQVMSVLTGLLQDAAQREATGRGEGLVLDNPAIEISVTPVEGQTSLLRAPTERRVVRDAGREAGKRQLAGGTPR